MLGCNEKMTDFLGNLHQLDPVLWQPGFFFPFETSVHLFCICDPSTHVYTTLTLKI